MNPGCARVVVDTADAEHVADVLWLHGATAVGERDLGGRVELEAGFETPEHARAAVDALALPTAHVVDAEPALHVARQAWMAHARPVRVGRIHVRPCWLDDLDDPPAPDEFAVLVDPSHAFGSGSHPSTAQCLAAVDRFAAGSTVLDVGCGSGVLSVASAVVGATSVVAVDVDPIAVSTTEANATRNGVETIVDVQTGSAGDAVGRFDLVLANVGAATALSIAGDLAARCAPGGRLVVAGLYEDRAEELASALDAVGFVEEDRSVVDGWACLIHHSPSAMQHTVQPASSR